MLGSPANVAYGKQIQKIKWPQDKIIPPLGYGGMPDVDLLNARSVKREFFCYSTTFNGYAYGQRARQLIATDDDGDFYLCRIDLNAINTTVSPYVALAQSALRFNVTDMSVPYTLFNISMPIGGWFDGPGTPQRARSLENIQQIYGIPRMSAIAIDIESEANTLPDILSIFVTLIGWKEYRNASR